MIQNFNYHTHTSRCGHAVGTDEEYVLAAIEAGYKVLGFSDHAPYRDYPSPRVHMNWEQLDDYIQSVTKLKEKYKDQIEIHLGLETEFYPYALEEKKELRSQVEYLILGQHFSEPTGKLCSYFKKNTDAEIEEYADMVVKGLESGMFTYLAHPDVFMNYQPEFNEACQRAAERIAEAAVRTNTPVEVNVRGTIRGKQSFPNGMRYYYPNYDFWKVMANYPVKCVIGIDAHDPEDLIRLSDVENAFKELEDLHLDFVKEIHFR